MNVEVRKLQILRRTVQVLVVVGVLLIPTVARYENYVAAREIDRVLERWKGTLPGAVMSGVDRTMRALPRGEHERAGRLDRDREQVLLYAQTVRGSAWSAQIGPLSMSDPLAVAESAVATRRLPRVLIVSLLVPLAATLLLGRVFCSWICPMGLLLEMTDKLRAPLRYLELHPRNLRAGRGTKYGLLAVGLITTALLSVPVLGYVYPPAILSRELHDLVFGAFDRAELGRFGFSLQGLSWMALLVVAIVAIELTVSRRWWCRYVCPGGALYSLLGWARPVRVKLASSKCTECALCVVACPMGLNPMRKSMGIECDNCGACISSCHDDALDFALDGPLAGRLRKPTGAGHSIRPGERAESCESRGAV